MLAVAGYAKHHRSYWRGHGEQGGSKQPFAKEGRAFHHETAFVSFLAPQLAQLLSGNLAGSHLRELAVGHNFVLLIRRENHDVALLCSESVSRQYLQGLAGLFQRIHTANLDARIAMRIFLQQLIHHAEGGFRAVKKNNHLDVVGNFREQLQCAGRQLALQIVRPNLACVVMVRQIVQHHRQHQHRAGGTDIVHPAAPAVPGGKTFCFEFAHFQRRLSMDL